MPDVSIPELSVAELRARLNVGERRIPIEGTIEPTYRCNLRCAHCYVNQPAASRREQQRELPLERLLALLDEIAEAGCLSLLLTGGEALVRPDFPKLYLHAIHRGLLITVFTNGTLVTDSVADLFAEYRPEGIEVTLYGMTRGTYERITRTPGSFQKCLEGIERLAARRLPLKLKTMAMAWNRHEIPVMAAFAREIGARFAYDCHLNPRLDSRANRREVLQLDASQVAALDLANPDRVRELREFCGKSIPPEPSAASERLYVCGAGETAFVVDPYGTLQLCQLARRDGFDLRHDSFRRGWAGHIPTLRSRRWTRRAPCRTCTLMSLCASCAGTAELEHGDAESLVPAFCQIAHRRAFAVGGATGHRADAECCLGAP